MDKYQVRDLIWQYLSEKIDSYEGFIGAMFIMAKSKKCVNYPLFGGTELTHEMNFIWKFVKEHIQ